MSEQTQTESMGADFETALAQAQAVTAEMGAVAPGADGQPSAGPEPVAVLDPQQESAAMWGAMFMMLDSAVPQVAAMYPEQKRKAIVISWAQLAQQEGWQVNMMGGKWSVRIMFALAVVPEQLISMAFAAIAKRLGVGEQAASPAASAPKETEGPDFSDPNVGKVPHVAEVA